MSLPRTPFADEPLILVLDIGTSSVRAGIYDAAGDEMRGLRSQTIYSMMTTADGGVEMDADRLVGIVASNIDEVVCAAQARAERIRWAGISAFWHGVVGAGESGKAVTPIFSWNDTRSSGAASALRSRLDEEEVRERTGCRLHASYLPAKILWFAESQPSRFRTVRRWLSFGEYLFLRLFGLTGCSVSMASATGLFHQEKMTWDPLVLEALPVDQQHFSPILDDSESFTELRPEFTGRWPALSKAKWFPAWGDGACNNAGTGCLSADRIALMAGTSGAMRVVTPAGRLSVPPALWRYRVDRKRRLVGGALSNGGDLYSWMTKNLRLPDADSLEAELAAMGADEHGLTVLPFLSGERSTGWSADARGWIAGLSLSTRPAEILRAGLEAVAYRFAAVRESLGEAVPGAQQIIASGSAFHRSKAWTQILADVLGMTVAVSADTEASSRGAALLALEHAGEIESIDHLPPRTAQHFQPDADRHARYLVGRQRHERLYEEMTASRSNAGEHARD